MTSLERHVKIITPNFTYSGSMTQVELKRYIDKYNLSSDDVIIENLALVDFDEIDLIWTITKTMNETVLFK